MSLVRNVVRGPNQTYWDRSITNQSAAVYSFSSVLITSTSNQSYAQLMLVPVKYAAIRIGYSMIGGSGDVTNMEMLAATTDEIGTLDMSADADDKKFITPMADSSEVNTISFDGWRNVTWDDGNATKTISDPGAGNSETVWSDLINLQAKQLTGDPFPGYYPVLVRFYGANAGAGTFTLATSVAGMNTTTLVDDSDDRVFRLAARSGNSVATPGNWAQVNTPNYSSSASIPLHIIAYGSDSVRSAIFVGDSRFASPTTADNSFGYRNAQWRVEKAAEADGMAFTKTSVSQGGATSDEYFERAAKFFASAPTLPKCSVYLIYTVNDGSPTEQIIAESKYKAMQHVITCRSQGVRPILVTSFPTGGGFNLTEMALLEDVDAFASNLGELTISPLTIYGTVTGDWQGGFNQDGNHFNNAGQEDFAGRLWSLIKQAV